MYLRPVPQKCCTFRLVGLTTLQSLTTIFPDQVQSHWSDGFSKSFTNFMGLSETIFVGKLFGNKFSRWLWNVYLSWVLTKMCNTRA